VDIRTTQYALDIDDTTGALRSLAAGRALERELLSAKHEKLPLFTIHYLDDERRFRQVSSAEASRCDIRRDERATETHVHLSYAHIGALDADVDVTVRCPHDDGLSYWSLSLTHRAPVIVTNVQFPIVVVPYRYEGRGPTNLLVPLNQGEVYQRSRPEQLQPDYADVWQFTEDSSHHIHYPGTTFAQFLAYYDEKQGVYLGCHDANGRVKIIKPVHHEQANGIRLGIAHVVGWDQPGQHDLGYEVALGVFDGDWHDAADLYRRWYEAEAAPGPRLRERQDVPAWLLDSPLHVIMRIQGELDAGPVGRHPEFTPYSNALPLLDRLSEQVGAPLTPVIMSWEHPGPWVYPDSFPVAGGDESLRAFTAATRARGWHVGTYCNGTRWVIGHKWTGYDGDEYYRVHDGESGVCRLPDGTPWRESWDRAWRPSYMSCMAAPHTQDIAVDYVAHLLDLGLDWIQFLDQNCGAAAYPCYSREHGHPPAPGGWMSDALSALLARLEERAATVDRETVFSVENAPNDHFRGHFHICDIRPDPEGRFVPLYQYLFHEYILTQAAFALAPNPYWMQIKTAHSFVLGDLLTAIIGPEGRLMAWAGHPWAAWDTPPGDQDGILTLLRRAIALRRGVGSDFLVFGRLLRPLPVQDIAPVTWLNEGQVHSMPAVLHAHWQAADGRTALALANWTTEERVVRLDEQGERQRKARYHGQYDIVETSKLPEARALRLALAPLSVALLEWEPAL